MNETLHTYDISESVKSDIQTSASQSDAPKDEKPQIKEVEPKDVKTEWGANLLIFPNGTQKTWVTVPHHLAQSTMDRTPTLAVTDQGTIFNPYDNLVTHFSGHVYGGFDPIIRLQDGQIVTVTDHNKTPHQYRVIARNYIDYLADGDIVGDADENWFFHAIGHGYGESLILQTCTRLNADKSYSVILVIATKI